MNRFTFIAAAALVVLGAGCDPDQAARVAVDMFDAPVAPSPPIRPNDHHVLPDVSFEATTACPAELTITSTDDEPFFYLVTFGETQLAIGSGVPALLQPGQTATVDLAPAIDDRAMLFVNHEDRAAGIAALIDVRC